MRRRRYGTFQLLSLARSFPATWIRPSDGRSSLRISRRKVDLPEPDGPTRKTNSPFSTSRVTFSRAGRLWFGYAFVTLSKWITGLSRAPAEYGRCGRGKPAGRSYLAFPAVRPVWPQDSLGGKLVADVQHWLRACLGGLGATTREPGRILK